MNMKTKANTKEEKKEYAVVFDRRTGKYGVHKVGHEGWWIEPVYDDMDKFDSDLGGWIKKNGRYGFLNVERREEVIPCEYGTPIHFRKSGYAEVWKDYKAGAINIKNEEVIPIIYDDMRGRYQYVKDPNRRFHVDNEGKKHYVSPKYVGIFKGYACFTNEGIKQAYDENMQPCEFQEWERDNIERPKYKWNFPTNARRTVEEIEAIISKEYRKLIDMGYDPNHYYLYYKDEIEKQRNRVMNHIYDRNHILDASWAHNYENAKKIERVNDLLMRAVAKAAKLGKKTAESLQWMEKTPHRCRYEVEIYVHPEWSNDKSRYDYKPKEQSEKKERERLADQECDAENNIWNIITMLSRGDGVRADGRALCFYKRADKYKDELEPDQWDLRSMVLDDGNTWDEGIHFPAYMDAYFTVPFHYLFFEHQFAYADLVNINDFRVKVEVKLETKESDKLPRKDG